jgi:hypothetical protein
MKSNKPRQDESSILSKSTNLWACTGIRLVVNKKTDSRSSSPKLYKLNANDETFAIAA